ncbi:tetratricopeptide repeat protein [Acidisphaera sp. L21]|uniref:tetratricopeptide repeat protein n=1 Tax=Acidisphaera sp. L21 TaxID=1641851 RepID=UPI001C2059BB|nr:tetratricopeptide repeat protein [Acidisphaera sp. L21]
MTDLSAHLATVDTSFLAAVALHRMGRIEEAELAYDGLLAREPSHGPTLHMAGMLAFQQGRVELAAQRVGRALARGHRSGVVLEHHGLIQQHRGDLAGAAASFREGLALDPVSGSLWFNLGVVEREAGRLGEAVAAFSTAAPLLQQGFAERALGQVLQDTGRGAEAAVAYARALAMDPSDAASALNAGVIAQQAGDLAAAAALYRQALAAGPALMNARINLACVLQESGDVAAATMEYQAILREAPQATQAMNNLGTALRSLGRDDEAEAWFRRVLETEPCHPEGSDNLTKLLLDLGRVDEAVAVRRQLCATHPADGGCWLELARVLGVAGQQRQAEDALRQALVRDPGLGEAHCALGDAAHRRRDWAGAAVSYRAAAVLARDRTEPQLGLALVALKSGDPAAALAACDAVLRHDRFDQGAIAYRTLALQMAGLAEEAQRLSDPDELVTVIDLDIDAGALGVLAADLIGLRHREYAPRGQSVRGGTQTSNELFAEPVDSIRQLRGALDAAIGRYLAKRPVDDAHPFFAAMPAQLHYHSWSIVLRASGYHVPHIHPGGCLSGVFYVAVPPFAGAEDAGCLEIGRPGFEVPLRAAPKRRLVRAVPGRLVLFPSYLWHGTRPFEGPGERVTVAFDIRFGGKRLPVGRW